MQKIDSIEIFYDGECPLCKKEMDFLKKRDKNNLLVLVDISATEFDPRIIGKTKDQLMARIHAKVNDQVLEGVEVFREAYSRVGLGWILWLTKFPVFKQLADIGYIIFARYRIPIGKLFGRCDSNNCELR